jgi:pimeloyl-ACP methyl ester carboxylesterase
MRTEVEHARVAPCIDGVQLHIASASRRGHSAPIVFLHGFGSTKEDYADIALLPQFAGRPYLAYDAPGCGQSVCEELSKLSIPFFAETARSMLRHAGIDRFHLVGHSMGGLTALVLADHEPERVLSFVNIEGNLAPEDCFLSRQVITHPAEDDDAFLDGFIERTLLTPAYANALYAAGLRHKVRAGAVRPIFTSMVELSDHGGLMGKFLGLPCPRMHMHGEQNGSLSYLAELAANGIEVAEISHSGHFPMYSNPVAMWERIARFHIEHSR